MANKKTFRRKTYKRRKTSRRKNRKVRVFNGGFQKITNGAYKDCKVQGYYTGVEKNIQIKCANGSITTVPVGDLPGLEKIENLSSDYNRDTQL